MTIHDQHQAIHLHVLVINLKQSARGPSQRIMDKHFVSMDEILCQGLIQTNHYWMSGWVMVGRFSKSKSIIG